MWFRDENGRDGRETIGRSLCRRNTVLDDPPGPILMWVGENDGAAFVSHSIGGGTFRFPPF